MVVEDPADRSIHNLVALLTAHSAPAGPAARAAEQVLQRDAAGDGLVGLRRLCAGLAEGTDPGAQHAEVCGSDPWHQRFVGTLRRCPIMVAHVADDTGLAQLLAALLDDGHRVLVTGPDSERWPLLRDALPPPLHGLCGQGPIPLSDLEQRELGTLLLTETPDRLARLEQKLPAADSLPDPERVAALCRAIRGDTAPARDALELLPELLGELSPAHFATMVATAVGCSKALRSLDAGGISSWARPLLERVLFGAERAELTTLLRSAGEVVDAAEALSGSAYRMAVVGPPDPDAAERLRAYIEFLDAGGLPRRVLPPSEQRAVIPILHQLGLDRAALGDVAILRGALGFLELVISMRHFATICRRLRVPEPKLTPAAIARRRRELERVEEAVRAVEAFRREVLFIHANSPIAVPDAATADMVAREIVKAVDSLRRATAELNELADTLAGSAPESGTAAEVADLTDALRRGHLPDYLHAVERLSAARLQHADQLRQLELLARLREGAPELADAWEEPGAHRYTQGIARFFPLTELLSDLPGPDSADVVLLLDSQTVAPESLLSMAAAAALVAVSSTAVSSTAVSSTAVSSTAVSRQPGSTRDSEPASSASALAVVLRAGAEVIAAPGQAGPPSSQQAGKPEPATAAEPERSAEPPPSNGQSLSVPAQRNAPPKKLPARLPETSTRTDQISVGQ
jgi:hypothetical protein